MTLQDDFVRTGNWLFRFRSYLPVVLILALLVGMRNFAYLDQSESVDDSWDLFCIAVSFLGLAVRVITIGHTPERTSGRNTATQVADTLNTTGIYSIVRHPLYLGNYLMWLGISMFPHQVWLPIFVSVVFALYYERIMFAEESFLQGRFGSVFEAWAARTPAFFPNPRRWIKASLPFSFRNVLKREYSGLFALAAIFTALEVLGEYEVTKHFVLEWGWAFFLVGATLAYVVLRTLKRHTHVLHVPGR